MTNAPKSPPKDVQKPTPPPPKKTDPIQWLDSISVLSLHPGDTLVVRVKERLSLQAIENIKAQLQIGFGPEQQVLVLDVGMELGVLRPEKPEERPSVEQARSRAVELYAKGVIGAEGLLCRTLYPENPERWGYTLDQIRAHEGLPPLREVQP